MKQMAPVSNRVLFHGMVCALVMLLGASWVVGQDAPNERTFHQSKAAVEKALKQLQASMSGRLPVLDGFAVAGEHPLGRYQRAYYQSTVRVSPT